MKYTYAIWKRKTASAQVRLYKWVGQDTINGRDANAYITRTDLFDVVYAPLKMTKLKEKFYFDIKISGSGESAQAEAIRHGLSRALVLEDISLRPVLKEAGFLTRDARKVERKKPGLHKARKATQWSKR